MNLEHDEIERKMIAEGRRAEDVTKSILNYKNSSEFSQLEKGNIEHLMERIGNNAEWSIRLFFLQKAYLDKLDEKLNILNHIKYSINEYNQSSKNDRICRIIIVCILIYIAIKVS